MPKKDTFFSEEQLSWRRPGGYRGDPRAWRANRPLSRSEGLSRLNSRRSERPFPVFFLGKRRSLGWFFVGFDVELHVLFFFDGFGALWGVFFRISVDFGLRPIEDEM